MTAINSQNDFLRSGANSARTSRVVLMTTTRPNRQAMTEVIDIYRDAMRLFLVHHLRQVRGKRLEEAIKQALRNTQRNQFEDNRRKGNSIDESIDVGDFPELVDFYWSKLFSNIFMGDRSALNYLYEIRSIRNDVSHPLFTDLDEKKTRAHIYMVAHVLGRINRPEERKAVEEIEDKLFMAPTTETQSEPSDAPKSPPPMTKEDLTLADHSNLHESDNKHHTEPGCKLSLKISNPCPEGRECPRRPKIICGSCQRIRLQLGSPNSSACERPNPMGLWASSRKASLKPSNARESPRS